MQIMISYPYKRFWKGFFTIIGDLVEFKYSEKLADQIRQSKAIEFKVDFTDKLEKCTNFIYYNIRFKFISLWCTKERFFNFKINNSCREKYCNIIF